MEPVDLWPVAEEEAEAGPCGCCEAPDAAALTEEDVGREDDEREREEDEEEAGLGAPAAPAHADGGKPKAEEDPCVGESSAACAGSSGGGCGRSDAPWSGNAEGRSTRTAPKAAAAAAAVGEGSAGA